MNVVSFFRIMNFILLMIQRSVTCCETPRSNIQKEMKTESHELRRHCHAHTVWHKLHRIISIVSSDGSSSTAYYVQYFCCICIGVGSFSILGEGGGQTQRDQLQYLGVGGGGVSQKVHSLHAHSHVYTHVLNIHTPMHTCTHMYACIHSLYNIHFTF